MSVFPKVKSIKMLLDYGHSPIGVHEPLWPDQIMALAKSLPCELQSISIQVVVPAFISTIASHRNNTLEHARHYTFGDSIVIHSSGLLTSFLTASHSVHDNIPRGHLGIILRTYTSPNGGNELMHLRTAYKRDRPVRRQWHDSAMYRDQLVPEDILRQVYEVAGDSMDWTTTKKNTRLGLRMTGPNEGEAESDSESPAWQILEDWYHRRHGVNGEDSD